MKAWHHPERNAHLMTLVHLLLCKLRQLLSFNYLGGQFILLEMLGMLRIHHDPIQVVEQLLRQLTELSVI
jgi:hypothetical protein